MQQYGHFENNGSVFAITTPATPRNWYNYLWNDTYVTFTSQVGYGEGFIQDDLGRRIPVVSRRMVYIQDTENNEFWSANALPVENDYSAYVCRHTLGSSEIKLEFRGIESTFSIAVPAEGNCEYWCVTLKNTDERNRSLRLIPYAMSDIDGAYKPQGYNTGVAAPLSSGRGIACKGFFPFNSPSFMAVHEYFISQDRLTSFDCRHNAFIGTYHTYEKPKALLEGKGCTGSLMNGEKACFALEHDLTLLPGESRTFTFSLGILLEGESLDEVENRFSSFSFANLAAERFESYSKEESGVWINTPDENLNALINTWTKHQTNLGTRWARVRHNGYRDMTSDCECFAAVNPELAWKRLKRVLTYQYSNGYAPRTWLNGKIRDNNFADCAVWIPMAVTTTILELGDFSLLDEEVAFNDGSKASVYEHAKRAIDYLWNFRGNHGFIKLWGGDWNDMMNQAGLRMRGSSVWLSLAWYKANSAFITLAKQKGCTADIEWAEKNATEMRAITEANGWDGEYYVDAFNDDDMVIGSKTCEEGKIYLIPQLWAVLSGISTKGRDAAAMDAVEKYLETDLGTLVSWPAYHHYIPTIGQMTQKPAGVHENGGVYLHPACWKLAADSMLKRNEAVERGLRKILPEDTTYFEKKCEPYILCNSYFTNETGYREGTAGQTWRSATGAWFPKAVLQYVFGLQATEKGLKLSPCLPPSWKQVSVKKEFRGATYLITYTQLDEGGSNTIKELLIDGKPYGGDVLPSGKGKTYQVDVTLKK